MPVYHFSHPMALHNEVLALVLGGGQGTRMFPLTQLRSKPAVPIAGKYRLIDIPISIGQTYRMDLFSQGFVEILAAEQTPDSSSWFQGTADAVRQAARHITRHEADYYVVLAGDHLYRMDYSEIVEAHIDRQADITIAAQPVTPEDASSMGILRFDRDGQIIAFEEKPDAARLAEIGRSIPVGASFGGHVADKPFVASLGIYVFSREVLFEVLEQDDATDFGRGIIPHALNQYEVQAHLFRGYWADVGTIQSFYEANVMLTRPDAPFSFYDPRRPIYTRPRFLPGARLADCAVRDAIIAEGCDIDRCTLEQSVIGIRSNVRADTRITRSVLLGADFYESDDDAPVRGNKPRLGIGREVVLDRVIVDKNARIADRVSLTNAAGVQEANGNGYYIRGGIIIVPKDGVIEEGTTV
jgi:glucose-1-phosphate adenylyltransferase